jgi:hypothetical protein
MKTMTEAEATETLPTHKGRSALAQVAGVGMALLGSSMPGTSTAGAAHADHGYAPARWWAVSISALGWVVGGIAYPFGVWVLVALGAALQAVAIIVNLAMNAAGYGAASNDQWAQAKAAAKAARAEGS